MRLIADGWTNRAIAAELGISPLTVKSHIQRMAGRLDFTGQSVRTLLVMHCLRNGLID